MSCCHDVEEATTPYRDGDKYKQAEYTRLVDDLLSKDHAHHVPGTTCYDCCVVQFASERIHDLISEENGLRHNRVTWFANIEGFLWLSFAAVISEQVGWDKGFWLMVVIPVIGILVCISAISAIKDADHAVELLLKKWRTIQDRQPKNPYVAIPVLGLSNKELEKERKCSVPKWHFALFVLVGWIFGLVFVIVTKTGFRPSSWGYVAIAIIVWFIVGFLIGIHVNKNVRGGVWKF